MQAATRSRTRSRSAGSVEDVVAAFRRVGMYFFLLDVLKAKMFVFKGEKTIKRAIIVSAIAIVETTIAAAAHDLDDATSAPIVRNAPSAATKSALASRSVTTTSTIASANEESASAASASTAVEHDRRSASVSDERHPSARTRRPVLTRRRASIRNDERRIFLYC